ncbi:MAG: ABC transporter ATP-binding protein [Deltaproteobacteria bacterium]|nr:ABC transporter ATP-binding protein [Deltaproteobacteria bacterium]
MTGGELPVLEVRDLTVSFGALTAVCGMCFSAERGKITSIIGPNGAGKSTLFNLVSGGIRPSAGTVLFEGADVTGWAPYKLIRAGISRSFQITNLFFELPVYENLRLAAQALESSTKSLLPVRCSARARERVDELIEQFDLGEKVHELAGYLSHGEQRRLEIAVVLACRPRLLLLDEPTQGMSHSDTQEIGKVIRKLSGDLSILLIEHDIDLVMDLSDHVVVMHQGAKLAEGTPPEVKGNPLVQSAYLGLSVHAGN